MNGQSILSRVVTKLQDEGQTYWKEGELAIDLEAGINAIIRLKPDANADQSVIRLIPGPLQSLPDGAFSLVSIESNVGTNGELGQGVARASLRDMDRSMPSWRQCPPSCVIDQYMHDPRDPTVFHVYPPALLPAALKIKFTAAIQYADMSQPLPIDALYADAIFYYVLWQAFMKDTKRGENVKAMMFRQMFVESLGLQQEAQDAFSAESPITAQKQ